MHIYAILPVLAHAAYCGLPLSFFVSLPLFIYPIPFSCSLTPFRRLNKVLSVLLVTITRFSALRFLVGIGASGDHVPSAVVFDDWGVVRGCLFDVIMADIRSTIHEGGTRFVSIFGHVRQRLSLHVLHASHDYVL